MSDLFSQQLRFALNNRQYRGRFAPSPSGPLHFGSLIAALGSYLQAKKNQGLWFVRIEDIDKPREKIGAVEQILDGLIAFGLNWDTDDNTTQWLHANDKRCLVQTHRLERYQQIFDELKHRELIYACQCTRKQLKAAGGVYQGHCRELDLAPDNAAIRLKQNDPEQHFHDVMFGQITIPSDMANEDYIIKRRDGIFAYQLVVVLDDIDQGITEVVRGADIIDLTPRQLSLFKLFGMPPPNFFHLPLAATKAGFKLSKQNHADAINTANPKPELIDALNFLGLPTYLEPDLRSGSVAQIIEWSIQHWEPNNIPQQREIIVPTNQID